MCPPSPIGQTRVQAVLFEAPSEALPGLQEPITQTALVSRAHPSRHKRLQRLRAHLVLCDALDLAHGLLLRGFELGVVDEGADLQLLAV